MTLRSLQDFIDSVPAEELEDALWEDSGKLPAGEHLGHMLAQMGKTFGTRSEVVNHILTEKRKLASPSTL